MSEPWKIRNLSETEMLSASSPDESNPKAPEVAPLVPDLVLRGRMGMLMVIGCNNAQ